MVRGVLNAAPVTHRLEILKRGRTVVIEVHGLLDARALAGLRASLAPALERGLPARVVLRAGTEIERDCLGELRALDAEVVAEDAYLARWLAHP